MSDTYQGDLHLFSPAVQYDFSSAHVVVVSGDGINACGHMLLNTNGRHGWYFHVASLRDYPRYMGYDGYQRYLKENGKTELGFFYKHVPNESAARVKLAELLGKKWLWGVLPHNCVAFVEEVLQAGGSSFGLLSNCPALEVSANEWEAQIDEIKRSTTDEALMRYFMSR